MFIWNIQNQIYEFVSNQAKSLFNLFRLVTIIIIKYIELPLKLSCDFECISNSKVPMRRIWTILIHEKEKFCTMQGLPETKSFIL